VSYAIDEIALAALGARRSDITVCDVCDEIIEGQPGGSGLIAWTRGDDEMRFEEPPLCQCCAAAITAAAYTRWLREEEEVG
jgi:hypothetical protein